MFFFSHLSLSFLQRSLALFFFSFLSISAAQAASPIIVKDAAGRPIRIVSAQRIVSLNGTITEALFALGGGPRVVGRDLSSYYPKEVMRLPSVGYQHRLNAEGILRLRPTLVIGTSDVRPRTVLQQIRATGVPVLLLKQPQHPTQSQTILRKLGRILSHEKQAQALIHSMQQAMKKLAKQKQRHLRGSKLRVMFLYVRGSRARYVMGRGNAITGMLSLVGAENAVHFRGAKPISAEAFVASRPQVIIAFSKGVASIGGLKALKKLPGLQLTPAGQKDRYIVMDDLYLGGFGPRCGQAALDLFTALHIRKGSWVQP